MRAYKLRQTYEETLNGGRFHIGDEEYDIAEYVAEHNGEIVTEDPLVQGTLDNMFGIHGALFEVSEVNPETGEKNLVLAQVPGRPVVEADITPPISVQGGGLPLAGNIPAEHASDQSDYMIMTVGEIKDTLTERGIEFKGNASKAELVTLLDQYDTRQAQERIRNA